MHELYELKEMLCEELEEYGKKGELTAGALDVVDKLTHTIKNLDKIIEKCEDDEYSGNYGSYENRMMDGGNMSYARGRTGNVRRDSMGRYSSRGNSYARGYGGYSRDGEMIAELHELMNEAPNEKTRMEFQKFIKKIEAM